MSTWFSCAIFSGHVFCDIGQMRSNGYVRIQDLLKHNMNAPSYTFLALDDFSYFS